MVSTLVIFAVATLALVFVYGLLRSGYPEIRNGRDWDEKKHEIDVQIFRILLDRNEELQLQSFLSQDQFAAFQRRRIHLGLRMLRLVDENAGMLMELGRLVKMKGDPALALKVDELIATALQLRLNLFLARLCLYVKWLFPSATVSLPAFEMRYQQLLDSMQGASSVAA
ncbi:MAG: hypothetical protein JWN74_2960 [Acidobacteriaceae bacterium]|nr:hypothetical protein [Acidobacteriaceae bacterium]